MVTDTQAGESPFVTFVIPTYRRPDVLAITLDAVLAVHHPAERLRVVVVDDADSAETAAVVRARSGREVDVRYLPRRHGGAAGARNLGAREAGEGLIIFVDDDIVVTTDHVASHLRARQATGAALVNGEWEFPAAMQAELSATAFGRFRLAVERWVKDGIPKASLDPVRAVVPTVTACNLSVTVADFEALGGFDETFPHAGAEDQELSLRAEQRGYRMVYDRSIRLLHNDGRMDLRGFCERQRRGAVTTVVLAGKHPETAGSRAVVAENAPGPWPRRPRAAAKRLAKALLATRAGTEIALGAIAVLGRLAPNGRLLGRLYWMMTGVYIYAGVREGFDLVAPDTRARLLAEIARA
jgi:GT2 family glycosyltransferase